MIILTYVNEIINKLQDDSLPNEVKLGAVVFVLVGFATLSIINIIFYLLSNKLLDNKKVLEVTNKWPYLTMLLLLYKRTNIGFIVFEILFFFSIQFFLLYQSYRLMYFIL